MTYPGSRPVATPPVAPRCDFEALYALSDPPESSHPRFAMYPRVSDILAAALARHSKPLSAVFPKKVRRYAVADSQHFSVAQPINPYFACLCGNKVVSNGLRDICGDAAVGKRVPDITRSVFFLALDDIWTPFSVEASWLQPL